MHSSNNESGGKPSSSELASDYRYEQDPEFTCKRGHRFSQLRCFQGKLHVVRENCSELEIRSTDDCRILSKIDIDKKKQKKNVTIYDFEYVPTLDLIAIAASDHTITLWSITDLTKVGTLPKKQKVMVQSVAQVKLCWSKVAKVLYSAGVDHTIYVWDLQERMLKNRIPGYERIEPDFSAKSIYTRDDVDDRPPGHSDIVFDLMELQNGLIASASLDHVIHLWNADSQRHRGELRGHKGGVRKLACGGDILVSVGFDYDAYAWDVSAKKQVLRMQGHRCSLVGIEVIVTHSPTHRVRAITSDVEANFKVWDVTVTDSGDGLAPLLQTFTATPGSLGNLSAFTILPLNSASDNPLPTVVAAGNRLTKFISAKQEKATPPPKHVMFNSASSSFVASVGYDLQIWDGHTGLSQRVYPAIPSNLATASQMIACICTDLPRQRKLFVGTQDGNLLMFNYVNGALMMKCALFPGLSSPLTSLISCQKTQCLISCTSNGALAVLMENDCNITLLRKMKSSHEKDIVACAYSWQLSCIATGSSDGSLNVWDFQMLQLEGRCIGHQADITSLAFLSPYPMLASSDITAQILIWAIRPCFKKCVCVMKLSARLQHPSGGDQTLSILSLASIEQESAIDSNNRRAPSRKVILPYIH
jgi:WD40 repeat protein